MKTKIVATIGPKSESREVLSELIAAGMNVARMNFSHCTHEEYRNRVAIIRDEAKKQGKEVAVLQDLQGPRIRIGVMPAEGLVLTKGDVLTFTVAGDKEGYATTGKIFVDEPSLAPVLEVGHPIFLASGAMELVVKEKKGEDFTAEVVRGGTLFSRKGINVPETDLRFSEMMKKDVEDLTFALSVGVDYVAVSFVQAAEDVNRVRAIAGDKVKIGSKIESLQGLKNIDEIIKASDAIMIARGDLGIEIPMEEVPFAQKNLIRHAHWHNKGAIVATQMMLSMVENKKPTRAEVSDVANAVLDGADAVMLSEESAEGKYPVEAVKALGQIARRTEELFHETDNLL